MSDSFDRLLSTAVREYAEDRFAGSRYRDDEFVFSEKFEEKMSKMLKSEHSVFHRLTLTQARKAMCIAAIIAATLLASLSVEAGRDTIANFFLRVTQGYDTIEVNNEQNSSYPAKIEKRYKLSALPKEYALIDEAVSEDSVLLTYSDGEDEFTFDQYTKADYEADIDNENSVNSEVTYNGQKYMLSVMDFDDNNSVDVIWDNGEYVFMASGSFSKEKMLEICGSATVAQ